MSAWLFNEGTGSVAKDSSVGGTSKLTNHGDLLSGPTWVTGLHGYALDFAATNSRVELRNEAQFDFITLYSTWTIAFSFKATKLLAGIIFSKTGTFNSPAGFYIQAESDATGDIAFVRILSGATQKWVTPVIPLAKVAGGKPHVLILDYCNQGQADLTTLRPSTFKVFLDGTQITVTGSPSVGDITNNNLATISGWDDGTSASFNGIIEMAGLWRGDGQGPLNEGEARAITARVLGR